MLTSSARGSWLVRHDEGPSGRKRAGGASAVCDASITRAEHGRGLPSTVAAARVLCDRRRARAETIRAGAAAALDSLLEPPGTLEVQGISLCWVISPCVPKEQEKTRGTLSIVLASPFTRLHVSFSTRLSVCHAVYLPRKRFS